MQSSATERNTYGVHGLTVHVPFSLPGLIEAPSGAAVDYALSPGLDHGYTPGPLSVVEADLQVHGSGYQVLRDGSDFWFRFGNHCDFLSQGSRVSYRLHPGGDPTLPEALFPNGVLAALLGLTGVPLLHASAVAFGDVGIAFAGQSGSGKSSLAAALCREGALLLTDDTLRIALEPEGPFGLAGAQELRLRSGAERIFEGAAPSFRETADGRLGITPQGVARVSLRTLWIPEMLTEKPHGPARPQQIELRPLRGQERLMSLVKNLRIAGFSAMNTARLLPELRRLAQELSIYTARIPSDLILTPRGREQLKAQVLTSLARDR